MIKKITFSLQVALLFSTLALGQTSTPKMSYFRGGNLNMTANAAVNLFGGGIGSGISGGIVAPLMKNESSAIFINPAELALMDGSYFNIDYRIGVGSNSLVNQSDINSATDEYLQDTTMFIFNKDATPEYTQVNNADIRQTSGFSSMSFAFPVWNDFVISLGYNVPIQLALDLTVNGIETKLATSQDVGGNETTFDMILNTTISNVAKLYVSEVVAGFGTSIFNNESGYLSAGLSVSRYEAINKINRNLQIDGSVVLNGKNEYYFNQPNDILLDKNAGETNDFYWRVNGTYKDVSYGGKIALYFNPGKSRKSWANFSLVYDLKPEFKMLDENATNIAYQPKFIKGSVIGEGDNEFELELDSMNLAKPHLTVQKDNVSANEITLSIPSSLTFGFDAAIGEHSLSLNIIKYFGKLKYDYSIYSLGKEPTLGIKFAGNFKMKDKIEGWDYALIPVRLLFLDIDGIILQAFGSSTGYKNPYYRVGVGVMLGDDISSGFNNDYNSTVSDIFDLPLPNGIALSRKYTIFESIDIGVLVFGMPDLALKFSVGFNF